MKLALILSMAATLSACQNTPVINAPYEVESMDRDSAIVYSGDFKLEVEFDADYYKDGNGVGLSWNDIDINQVKEVKVFDENDNETENYILTSEQVSLLVDDIEEFYRTEV